MKRILYLYERSLWYIGQAYAEVHKPLIFFSELVIIATFLKVSGYSIGLWGWAGIYIFLVISFLLVGKILSKLGIIHYNTSITNEHNSEITEILKDIREIKERLK